MNRGLPKPNESWQHQNGDVYKIYDIAKGSSKLATAGDLQFAAILEADLDPALIYLYEGKLCLVDPQCYMSSGEEYVLYYKPDFPFKVWARSLSNFMEDKEGAPRFRKLNKIKRAWVHKRGFSDCRFIALHLDDLLYMYLKGGDIQPADGWSVKECEQIVAIGHWKEITEEEALKL